MTGFLGFLGLSGLSGLSGFAGAKRKARRSKRRAKRKAKAKARAVAKSAYTPLPKGPPPTQAAFKAPPGAPPSGYPAYWEQRQREKEREKEKKKDYDYDDDDDEVDRRLARMQKEIEAKRKEREKYQEQLRKQAAYTRDTTQWRPKGASYATEAEKLMGGQTGYGNLRGLGFFGAITALEKAVKDVEIAASAIKKLTKDVNAGLVPKSDLKLAIKDLQEKAAVMGRLKKQGLSGFGDEPKSKLPWLVFGVIGLLFLATSMGK